ncbi:hypothetical protein [Microcystis aeruginosa]|uniref:hypothetical protein n=1 Tax=Microcystis aeruginosa TaxID=1126 RepID=UPI001562A61A|nr:hypothetical protein [Microcystis aeruginosa]
MVRSPKSIAGAVALALGNAPYHIGDRTIKFAIALKSSSPSRLLGSEYPQSLKTHL